MVNQIELAIASKVDGIITMPIAPTAMRPVFKKAAEAKIPVVFVGADDPESTALAFVGTNEAELGRRAADAIKAKFAKKGNPPLRAIVMQSTMDASFAIKARDGYLDCAQGLSRLQDGRRTSPATATCRSPCRSSRPPSRPTPRSTS